MPGTYAHLMITERALDSFKSEGSINQKLRGYVLTNSHFVSLGSVAPDYAYLDLMQPRQKDWADHMHYDFTGELVKTFSRSLLSLREQGLENESFIVPFCWTLGYISHVTADLVVHPIVMGIVGEYKGHEADHRHCEMIQDAFIYHKVRNGAEIEHSQLMEILKNCSNPENDDEIHPALKVFWENALRTHFQRDFTENPPQIDKWHDRFEDFISIAGDPPFIGRIADPNHKFTYKKSYEITPEERNRFLDSVPLPSGGGGSYETDAFPKAVTHVLDRWLLIAKCIQSGDLAAFLLSTEDCNLDTGEKIKTAKYEFWEVV